MHKQQVSSIKQTKKLVKNNPHPARPLWATAKILLYPIESLLLKIKTLKACRAKLINDK